VILFDQPCLNTSCDGCGGHSNVPDDIDGKCLDLLEDRWVKFLDPAGDTDFAACG